MKQYYIRYGEVKNCKEKIDLQAKACMYAGLSVLAIPEIQRRDIAIQVRDVIAEHVHTMLPQTEYGLLASMEEGRVVCMYDDSQCLAFAQVWQYEFDGQEQLYDEQQEKDLRERNVFEIGSWYSNVSGFGRKVFEACIQVGRNLDPDAFIIAIVEQSNFAAQRIITVMGGIEIGQKKSLQIKDEYDRPVMMNIYNMSSAMS